jgi:archaellum component FlaC
VSEGLSPSVAIYLQSEIQRLEARINDIEKKASLVSKGK